MSSNYRTSNKRQSACCLYCVCCIQVAPFCVLGENPQVHSRCNHLPVSQGCGSYVTPGLGPRGEASLLCGCTVCCLVQGACQLFMERAFGKGLVEVRRRGEGGLFVVVVRLTIVNLTLARVYWPMPLLLRFCTPKAFKITASSEGVLGFGFGLFSMTCLKAWVSSCIDFSQRRRPSPHCMPVALLCIFL